MLRKVLGLSLILFFAVGLVFSSSVFSKKYEKAERGWLGVYIEDLNWEMLEALDLESGEGVLIAEVVDDSPAEKAGLKAGDVVLFFDKNKIGDVNQFIKLVSKTKPGERAKITVIRDGDKKRILVKMGKKPEKDLDYKIIEKKSGLKPFLYSMGMHFMGEAGLKVQDLTEQLGDYFGVKDGEGALITEVEEDGPAHKAGLKAGDVIVRIDGERIEESDDVWEEISEKEEGDRIKIQVLRNGHRKTFSLEIEEGGEEEWWYSKFFPEVPVPKVPKAPEIKRIIVPERKKLKEPLRERILEKELREELKELKKELKELKEELEDLKKELF